MLLPPERIIMNYFGFFLMLAVLTVCYIVMRTAANSNRHAERKTKEFLSRESEANSVRRADISGLAYVKIPLDTLPLAAMASTDKPELVDELRTLADKKILNLSMYTNTDLKMMYGPANLDELTVCDDNFTTLIRLLDAMGKALYKANLRTEAIRFLEYAISIDSDITNTYTLLGSLYHDKGNKDALDHLIKKSRTITSLSGKTITSLLYSIKSDAK